MSFSKQKVGDKNFIAHAQRGAEWISVDAVLSSWKNNSFSLPVSKSDTDVGFRSAQLGAVYAIKSHWTVSSSAATVVMPTGERVIIVTGCINALISRITGTFIKNNSCTA